MYMPSLQREYMLSPAQYDAAWHTACESNCCFDRIKFPESLVTTESNSFSTDMLRILAMAVGN